MLTLCIVSLLYELLTSTEDNDALLSVGFDRDRNRRQRELTNNKNQKSNFHLRFFSSIFSFAEHQLKCFFGLRYKLTLTANGDCSVLNKDNAINNGRIRINAIEW